MSPTTPPDDFDRPSEAGFAHADEPTRVPGGGAVGTLAGPQIEGYTLLEELHRGGQGIVYRALQLGTKREVALKVLLEGPFASDSTRRRFEREIELAANLRHPSIVTILDSGLSMGRYYFAMEFIHGERLDRYLARHRPPIARILELFERICLAVNYAHQRGVLHRDLKPPNILVDDQGEPRILDFGLAKHLPAGGDDTTIQVLSTTGQILGTVAYMSPEQAAGSHDVDVRSDVYALGVIFYEALVGQPPYTVSGPLGEILTRIAHDDPINPRSLAGRRSGIPVDDEVATILLKALEKEPQRRYQTAGDLARDLRRKLSGDPIEAKRASGLYMFRKVLRRYRLQAAAAATILLMLVAFLIVFAVLFTRERDASQRASSKTQEAERALTDREAALRDAMQAQQKLRRALVLQHIQRGDLALTRHDLADARDSYWSAFELAPELAARWALRRYYLEAASVDEALLDVTPLYAVALSPNCRYAAVGSPTDAVRVRDLKSGAVRDWFATPAAVRQVAVSDAGVVVAAGTDWVRWWAPGEPRPRGAAVIPDFFGLPQAVFTTPAGDRVIIVGAGSVAVVGGDGAFTTSPPLQRSTMGPCDFLPQAGHVAVATGAGVELVTIGAERIASQIVWPSPKPPFEVRFLGDERLGLLAGDEQGGTDLFIAPLADLPRRAWQRVTHLPLRWDHFDLDPARNLLALASVDGRVALYQGDQLVDSWTSSGLGYSAVRVLPDEIGCRTLDSHDQLTRWLPAAGVEQRRRVLTERPADCISSADGAMALLAFERGRVMAYRPAVDAAPRTLLRPRMFGFGGVPAFASSADGARAVVLDGNSVHFIDVATGDKSSPLWPAAPLTAPTRVALSDDGTRVAIIARSPSGDRQLVTIAAWNELDVPLKTFDFVGSEIVDLRFLPHSPLLVVARSNGQLLRLDTSPAVTASAPTVVSAAHRAWLELDAAYLRMTINASGTYLVGACTDDTLRIFDLAQTGPGQRIALGARVTALSCSPRDNVVLARTADGIVRLIDLAGGELIAQWAVPPSGERPLGAWLAPDVLVLDESDGVYEHRYDRTDALIVANRPAAQERAIARDLAAHELPAAWAVADALCQEAPQRGGAARLAILDAALRQSSETVRGEWSDAVLSGADAETFLRLGHAAYAGERFVLAGRWLSRGAELAGEADALTVWRRADCAYLADDYSTAIELLAGLEARPDFDPANVPVLALQRVAALAVAGRTAEARAAAARIGESAPGARDSEATFRVPRGTSANMRLAMTTTVARGIARLVTEFEGTQPLGPELDRILPAVFEEQRGLAAYTEPLLLFYDDVHFFAAELLRARGREADANTEYQRCIDIARDAWPANWARARLEASNPIRGPQVHP